MTHFNPLQHACLGCRLILLTLLVCGGCDNSVVSERGILGCSVTIDGQPASDVRVVMSSSSSGSPSPVLEGVSDNTGIAKMLLLEGAQLPSGDSIEFRVAVESLGDWNIIKPWADIDKSPLSVTWNRSDTRLQVEIPRKAIKPL